MSFVRFDIIAKVVELGSFTAAAEALNMTQSAVSHAVASLETEWGCPYSFVIEKGHHADRYRSNASPAY